MKTLSNRGSDYVENCSVAGLPNAFRAKSHFKRFIWVVLVLGGLGCTSWQILEIVLKYYSLPTNTEVSMTFTTKLRYPAVTICNLNPIRHSGLVMSPNFSSQYEEQSRSSRETHEQQSAPTTETTIQTTTTTKKTTTTPRQNLLGNLIGGDNNGGGLVGNVLDGVNNILSPGPNTDNDLSIPILGDLTDALTNITNGILGTNEVLGTKSNALQGEEDFVTLYSSTDAELRKAMGHHLKTMLLKCTFAGFVCTEKDFSYVSDPKYGNCYTFNSGLNKSYEESRKTGPTYGLSLELYVQQSEYLSTLAPSAGVKIMMHNQSYMPFLVDRGIELQPGTKASVAIAMTEIERPSPPHGSCHAYTDDENIAVNVYSEEKDLRVGYTEEACYKTCFQNNVIKNCRCCYPYYPCIGRAINSSYVNYDENNGYCQLSSNITSKCITDVENKYVNDDLDCSNICKPRCRERQFPSQLSSSLWPADPVMDEIIKKLIERDPSLEEKFQNINNTEKRLFMRDNVLKVDIFYRELNYQTVATKATYQIEDLLANIGGQLGLFVGLSVISILEFIELLIDFVCIAVSKCFCSSKKENKVKSWNYN
ncbi:hypothetical protein LOTGIDRAFT_229019 [Lottia gigantea]|uniref:Uncharacterized protein n=1 Tax=Lottia gigantea TaxID=225164 RepID=V4A2D3_LOTGI|nr:hypothetical protein LOTGIDRAFT_229019 [Lottia gigantea]ESO89095.1 hypothetical protein LOTGIDRAFT_229019 [Lottia gigantea]